MIGILYFAQKTCVSRTGSGKGEETVGVAMAKATLPGERELVICHAKLSRARAHKTARRCADDLSVWPSKTIQPRCKTPEKDPDDWTTGDEPMTGPQRSYLQTLCREGQEEFNEKWTKAEASKKIDELQNKTGRGKSS